MWEKKKGEKEGEERVVGGIKLCSRHSNFELLCDCQNKVYIVISPLLGFGI